MNKWIIAVLAGIVISCNSTSPPKSSNTPENTEVTAKMYTEYYGDGSVRIQGMKKGDKRIGKWEAFYQSGYKWSEMNYRDGLKHGPTVVYYDNGIMRYQGMYENDERSDLWIFYDTNGVILNRINMDETLAVPDSLFN